MVQNIKNQQCFLRTLTNSELHNAKVSQQLITAHWEAGCVSSDTRDVL